MYDVVTLGEAMLRLSPPGHERLRRARTLDLHVCGSQGNVAANLARLGLKTAFATRVPDSALGLLVRDHFLSCGVDVTLICPTPNSRLGLNFIEFGATPRASSAVYDRKNSAASTIAPGDFDWNTILGETRFTYTDGIFPGLSDTGRAAAADFIAAAKRCGCLVGFDVNYREHLWPAPTAAAVLAPLLEQVDILLTTRGDAGTVLGCDGSAEQVARRLHERFGCGIVCLAVGEVSGVLRGSIGTLVLHENTVYESRRHEVDAIDRFGAGDAIGSGLIYSVLRNKDMQYAAEFAAAMGALDFTAPGDVAHVTPAEVEAIMGAIGFHVKR
jgi:2-dehydro-3-deoxygluconokinase